MGNKEKEELRSEIGRVLKSLDERWVKAASIELCNHLKRLINQIENGEEGKRIQRILAWTRFFPGEIDLAPFISSQLGEREIYLPRSLPDRSMNFISIGESWATDVRAGAYGIPEPEPGTGREFDSIGTDDVLVLVPGIAFDRGGNRLGRGGGYYDLFLGHSQLHSALKVGVLWELQLVEKVSVESHDVPVDWICHERGFEFSGVRFEEED